MRRRCSGWWPVGSGGWCPSRNEGRMSERNDTNFRDLWREAMRRRRWISRIECALQEIPVRCPVKGFDMSREGWRELGEALRAVEKCPDISGACYYWSKNWADFCELFDRPGKRVLLQVEADRMRQVLNGALVERQMRWASLPTVLRFNVNERVRVKLTQVGRMKWADHYRGLPRRGGWDPMSEIDADGWLTCQLHQVMNIFGPECYAGSKIPFDTVIEIDLAKAGLHPVH